jgi:hypothetical protein
MIVQILIVMGLIGLQRRNHKPWSSALIYTLCFLFLRLFAGWDFLSLIFWILLVFAVSYIYFWLLEKFDNSGFWYWFILLAGFMLLLV